MARIGVMTFLHNGNVGSALQAWALQTVLTDLGHEVEDIDYRPSKAEKLRNLLRSGNSPALVLDGMRKRRAPSYSGAKREHERFIRERLRLSPVCADRAALARVAARYDLLLCGSDQVWSPVWLNPAYFLDFTDKPRVAYAPSLGVRTALSRRKRARLAALTAPFQAISVREKEGAELLEAITGKRPVVLPDPVALLPRERWLTLAGDAENVENAEKTEPYLLCYFLGDRPDYWAAVAEIAKRENLAVRVIPRTQAACQAGYPLLEDVSPEAWLRQMNGAAHIVTDSFHGAAFACVLNRPFTVLRRYREDDPESKNSRIDQLLRMLELTDTAHVDWEQVNARLAAERERALGWLADATNIQK